MNSIDISDYRNLEDQQEKYTKKKSLSQNNIKDQFLKIMNTNYLKIEQNQFLKQLETQNISSKNANNSISNNSGLKYQ